MRSAKHTYFLLFSAIVVVGTITFSCKREKDLPPEPVINTVTFDTPSREMIIDFTDGDGDFGISSNDPDFPPFLDPDSTIANPYYTNLWLDYYEKREGEWILVEPPGTFNFRVPVLTPAGQSKQLEVKITYDMSFDLPLPTAESDTIKFVVTLVDRAKNESVPMETDPIIFGE